MLVFRYGNVELLSFILKSKTVKILKYTTLFYSLYKMEQNKIEFYTFYKFFKLILF